jgi:hypothetical protein
MQLPRGTFREIRKSVAVESLLQELDGERFTGVASISSSSRNGTLVFKAGKCILVKVQNLRGDAAWDEVQSAGEEEVDAALSVLGDAQIELALEFNKPFRILKPIRPGAAPAGTPPSASSAATQHPRAAMAQKSGAPVAPLKPPVKPAPVHHHIPAPQTASPVSAHPPPHPFPKAAAPVPPAPPMPSPRQAEAPHPAPGEQPERERETESSFEADLDTFDTMDFDNVTDKIRTDCKTMIKQLHLDHLMER